MDRIVLEKQGRRGVVLEPDGTIRSVRLPKNAEVGSAIPAPWWSARSARRLNVVPASAATDPEAAVPVRRRVSVARRALAATAASLVLVFSAGIAVYAAPVSYVSLDNAMGVTLTLNRFNRVIAVTGHDVASRSMLVGLDLVNRTFEDGVHTILTAAESKGGIGFDIRTIVAVSSDTSDNAQSLGDRIRSVLETEYDQHGQKPDIETDNVAVSLNHEAKDLGISQGKLRLLRLLERALGDAYVQSDWIGRSTNELVAELERLGVDSRVETPEDSAHGHPTATKSAETTRKPEPTDAENHVTSAATPTHGSENRPSITPGPTKGAGDDSGHPTPAVTSGADD